MTMAVELFENATRMGSWRAPHQLFLIYADGLFSVPKNGSLALHYFRLFLDLTGGWREGGKAAADRAAEHDLWGAAVRYALLEAPTSLELWSCTGRRRRRAALRVSTQWLSCMSRAWVCSAT